MRKKILSCIASVLLATTSCILTVNNLYAQKDGQDVSIGAYRVLHSRILNEDRRLLISLPRDYEGSTIKYPVLFLLYGDQVKGYFAETVYILDRMSGSSEIPPLLVVGIANTERYRDNLPLQENGSPAGADKFLQFITDELIPYVNKNYRTADFRILVGPQAGATFGVYSMMENPRTFNAFILNNPFWIRYTRDFIIQRADSFFTTHPTFNKFLFISYGGSDDQPEAIEYVQRFIKLIQEKKPQDFQFETNQMSEDDRLDFVAPIGLKRALRSLFREYKFPETTTAKNLDELLSYYKKLSLRYNYQLDIPEFVMVQQADLWNRQQNFSAAQSILEYLLKLNPRSDNGLFRIGDVYRNMRNYQQAIVYYKKFLEYNNEPMVRKRLESLQRMLSQSAAYAIELALKSGGVDAAMQKYAQIKSDPKSKLYFDEREFNELGYRILAGRQTKEAIAIMKINAEMYPESANAFDSLAEAFLTAGEDQDAIKNYEKSLQLNPKNINAEKMLKKIKAKAIKEIKSKYLSLKKSPQTFTAYSTYQIALGDLDKDGDLDAVCANMGFNDSRIWFNDGKGLFTDSGQLLTQQGHGLGVQDLDGDGDLDIFLCCAGFGVSNVDNYKPSKIYFNDGSGKFNDSGQELGDSQWSGNDVVLADIDGDGDFDAIVAYYQREDIIYLNDGKGFFTNSGKTAPDGAVFADLDGDRDVDIFVNVFAVR